MNYNIKVTATADQTELIEKLALTFFEATPSNLWYEVEIECSNKQLMAVIVLMERLKLNKCPSYTLKHISDNNDTLDEIERYNGSNYDECKGY